MKSDSNKKRHRKRSGHESKSGGSRKARSKEVQPTSSFAKPLPSMAPVAMPGKKHPPPVWRAYLLGLAGVLLLVLFGGGYHMLALSWSLLLPGVALLIRPPRQSPGKWVDRCALVFLALLLLAFLPAFYWPDPDWRGAAVETFQIDLPFSLTVQPLMTLEAWLSALAGLGWFYAATSWPINYNGRKRFFLVFSVMSGILAALVLWGHQQGVRYPGAEGAGVFSFFPDPQQSITILAVAGVAAFGYFMTALGTRQVLPVLGLVAAVLCVLALVWSFSGAGVGVLFAGLLLWYVLQLKFGRMPKKVKVVFPVFLLLLCLLLLNLDSFVGSFAARAPSEQAEAGVAAASPTVKDVFAMIQDAPLSGHGLGNFSAVFPQYQSSAAVVEPWRGPESDLLWLTTETGLFGLLALLACFAAYFARCAGFSQGPSGSYRVVALAAVLVFLIRAVVDVPGHQPGTVYFAILLAALALPGSKQQTHSWSPLGWRIAGGVLVLCGLVWGLAGLSGLPMHSKVALAKYQAALEEEAAGDGDPSAASAVDQWIALEPLNWRAYHRRAMQELSLADEEAAAADFRRARFAAPSLGLVALEEGIAWASRDPERALAAWREMFNREFADSERAYARLLEVAGAKPVLLTGLSELSELSADFRLEYLQYLTGEDFMRELRRELEKDPDLGGYSLAQRTMLLEKWIRDGDKEAAGRFLQANEASLDRAWWLWSQLRKEQAQFEEAVRHIRGAISPPELPKVSQQDVPLERLIREFKISPDNTVKGAHLLQRHLADKNYRAIRDVTEQIIEAQEDDAPDYVRYWYAESYFQLQDPIESWFQFERYLKQVWAED